MEQMREENENKDQGLAAREKERHRELVGVVAGLVEEIREQRKDAKEMENRREGDRTRGFNSRFERSRWSRDNASGVDTYSIVKIL